MSLICFWRPQSQFSFLLRLLDGFAWLLLTRVGKGKDRHSVAAGGRSATEVLRLASLAGPDVLRRTLRALLGARPPGRGGGAGRELPSSNMAPREAGPAHQLPGFRCRAFWFRSNSGLAAPSSSSYRRSCHRRRRNVRPAAAGAEPVRAAPSDSGWGTGLAPRPSRGRPSSAFAWSGDPGAPSKQPPTESPSVGDPPLSTEEEWTPTALPP